MNIKKLTQHFSVSEQIKYSDIDDIAAMGFKTIINNRPDREVLFQPRTKTLDRHAANAGLKYFYLPVISGNITQKNIDDFRAMLTDAEGPVLAFCRTGTRSANLWAKVNPDDLADADISAIGAQAGYAL